MEKENPSCTEHGVQVNVITKDQSESYYTKPERGIELRNLLSYHKTDRKGVHMYVGDISKIEG